MSIKKNIPQVKALKEKVEELYGESLTTHWQFIDLVSQIEKKTKVHISETTLERVWNYSTRHYDNVSAHTLDVLSRYATGDSWKEFCKKLEGTDRESGFFTDRSISASDLNPGDQILIGWMPNRLCELTYLGIIRKTKRSKLEKFTRANCLTISELYFFVFQYVMSYMSCKAFRTERDDRQLNRLLRINKL